MTGNRLVVILSAVLVIIVFLLTFQLYSEGTREVLSRFREDQLQNADRIASQVEFFLQSRSRGLLALSSLVSMQKAGRGRRRLEIKAYALQIGRVYVKAVTLYDEAGNAVYSTAPGLAVGSAAGSAFFRRAKERKNEGRVVLEPASPEPLTFTLATPLYRKVSAAGPGVFVGVLSCTLDVNAFLGVGAKVGGNETWIIGKDGTLLFHSGRPDMVFRTIRGPDRSCRSCHPSFGHVEEMLARGTGVLDYSVGGGARRIAAFAPMSFGGASWVVVVAAPYDRVTGFVGRSLKGHLLLFVVVLLAFAAGSCLIVRNERMKVKAEQEAVRWQEKTAERRKAEEAARESERQLRRLSDQILTAQETERKRISRELHDELGQALTVMKLHMGYIEKNLSDGQDDLKGECGRGIAYVDEVIENVRRLSRDLSPIILEDFGLSAAVRWLVNNFAKRHGVKVTLDMADIDGAIPRRSHTIVYRVFQEALTNIGKHAEASSVSVTVRQDGGSVSFTIEDDGRGFDPEETESRGPEEKGLGIATMQGRVRMLGGTLAIRAERGKGTVISVSIPNREGGNS